MKSTIGGLFQSGLRPALFRARYCAALLLVPCLLGIGALYGQDTYQEFLKKQKEGEQKEKEAFEQYKDSVTKEYERFLEQERQAYRDYLDDIRKRWGKEKAKTSSKKEWVSYDADFSARRSVDFEKGQASVEVLVEKDMPDAEVRKRVGSEIQKMIVDRGETDPLEAKQKAPSPVPVLEGQIESGTAGPVTQENSQAYADEIVRKASVRRETVVGADGASRIAARVTIPLVPNHVRVRAEQYRETVAKNASRFGVDAPLVYAVMHTESCFNPRARSSAPAYGLMQLVPQSGARAAYLFIHGEDRVVSPDHLYDPSNNVELGAGYLSLLMTTSFKDVKDPLSRSYCAIAAYNTGPANVASTFTGKRNVPDAVRRINTMTPEEVFARMRSSLPYAETRNYILNVTERVKLYQEWR
jgi:membrane-bound lytic murein transglycosylase C